MKTTCFLTIVLSTATGCWGATRTANVLLHVYDLTGMREPDLSQAVGETQRIFRAAGIDLAWTKGDLASPEALRFNESIPGAPTALPAVIVAAIVPSAGRDFP